MWGQKGLGYVEIWKNYWLMIDTKYLSRDQFKKINKIVYLI